MPKIAIASNLCSEANDIAPFLSLRFTSLLTLWQLALRARCSHLVFFLSARGSMSQNFVASMLGTFTAIFSIRRTVHGFSLAFGEAEAAKRHLASCFAKGEDGEADRNNARTHNE